MRVIKFRGWDKDKKQILPVCDISFGDDGRALTTVFQTSPKGKYYHGLVDGENGVLMQFTNLLDKNGKEIYECDILDNSSRMNNYVVEWGRLSDGENETDCYGFIVPQGLDNEWYVKGNIYENPELLT